MIENNKKGFTMIELVTVIVVLSILGLFTFSFIEHASKTYLLGKGQSALYLEGVYIMERITRELSDATQVDTSSVPLTPSWSSTLTFTMAAHPSPPSGFLARTATTVTYWQNGRTLFRRVGMIDVPIGRNINMPVDANDYGFKVSRYTSGTGDDTIKVELKLTSSTDASIPPFLLTTMITPNNYGSTPYTGRSFNGDYYEGIKQ
jgi:prepilin-type N-terminal cleavage/methylation domain-containing protein